MQSHVYTGGVNSGVAEKHGTLACDSTAIDDDGLILFIIVCLCCQSALLSLKSMIFLKQHLKSNT